MANSHTNLIVNYIPQHINERSLHSIFSKVGIVESCKIMRDSKTGYSYGFGFVTFVNPEDSQKAIEQLNGFQIGNKRIKVSYARPSGDNIKDTNLYITNLPSHITEDDLESMFGKYGNIVQKNILIDKITGKSRGVAFVRFDQREEAQEAIRQLNGVQLEGAASPLSVKVAAEHGKQKAAYFAGLQVGLQHNFPLYPPLCSPIGRGDFVNPISFYRRNLRPNKTWYGF